MEKEFVNYNQALALKELRFDEDCLGRWLSITEWEKPTGEIKLQLGVKVENYDKNQCLAPLKQQVFKFFRDNYQLFYTIETNCSQLSSEWGFDYTIFDKENDKWLSTEPQNCPPGETTYNTYEEAESGCIDKLIELVKNK
jgi:hypothetical protein